MIPGKTCARLGVFFTLAAPCSLLGQVPVNLASRSPAATIVMPPKLVAGQQATLAVLDPAGRLAEGAVVEFTGGERVTTDATGRAAFTAPAEAGVLLARLPGRGVNASATVVALQANPPDGVQVNEYPRLVSIFDRFTVEGFGFRGEADGNRVLLGDTPALVLAASPLALVVLPGPQAAPGATQLWIEAGGRSPGPVPVTLVSLEMRATKKQLATGEKGKLIVRVRGSERRLAIEARNLAPQVVELPRGNVQRLTTGGGSTNIAEIEMRGVRVGDFSVSVRLVPGAAGLPDVEAARGHLLAARGVATGDWPERLDHIIRRLERNPQDVSRIRNELEKMLAERPEGEFGQLLNAAWQALLRR